ncbi:MAG: hypothetical protein IJA89_00815 [Clostridia bacterium]|nr:hypothetical protein [Clostridia bacterium]
MIYEKIRKDLKAFYFDELPDCVEKMRARVFAKMDEYDAANPNQNAFVLKAKLYETIAEEIEPRFFDDVPFYCETSSLVPLCDGGFNRGAVHANGWLFIRNRHLFQDLDTDLFDQMRKGITKDLYGVTQTYIDNMHIGLPMRKMFTVGLCGVYEELLAKESTAQTDEERDFFLCAKAGILALKRIAERFAQEAEKQGRIELCEIAKRVPWQPPKTFHEGLCAMAFLRKALGSLEGVGFNSFGRVDKILYPLYEKDIARGVSEEEMLDCICKFLLVWDSMLDTREKMQGAWEYELENTLTLGGCDDDGKPLYNEVTRLFLDAREKTGALYPKMMIRYSANSPQEYMEKVFKPLVDGQSFSLYESDDAIIPALVKAGVEWKDARDYVVGGCWDAITPECSNKFSGEYVSMLKPWEWFVHGNVEELQSFGFPADCLDGARSFEEVYARWLVIVKLLLMKKGMAQSKGSRTWYKVNPVGALSALLETCIDKRRDLTAGGGKYNRESVYLVGFADVVDSLLAIKKLCFDEKVCSIAQLCDAVRSEWQDETLRQRALRVCSYADGSEESARFAGKFFDDLYDIVQEMPTAYGGHYRMGFNVYTEVVLWSDKLLAFPNGRRKGDYFSPGLTPSRLQRGTTLSDLLDGVRYMDMQKCGGNATYTITLPAGKMDLQRAVEFFRAASRCGLQGMQPSCVSKEVLLRAQKEPENYGHIIVRVSGFSAPFVLLSPKYQDEFLSRNFYQA